MPYYVVGAAETLGGLLYFFIPCIRRRPDYEVSHPPGAGSRWGGLRSPAPDSRNKIFFHLFDLCATGATFS